MVALSCRGEKREFRRCSSNYKGGRVVGSPVSDGHAALLRHSLAKKNTRPQQMVCYVINVNRNTLIRPGQTEHNTNTPHRWSRAFIAPQDGQVARTAVVTGTVIELETTPCALVKLQKQVGVAGYST